MKPYLACQKSDGRGYTMGDRSHLVAETVTDDACLLEGGVLAERVREHVVRDIVTKVSDEKAEPGCVTVRQAQISDE
jgi:hypothetical protein